MYGTRAQKESAPWLTRRLRSPTRTRSCSTRPAAASSARAPPRSSIAASGATRFCMCPAVVMWECSLLARVSRINLRRTVRAFFDDLFSNPSYQPLDVTPEQVFRADELRFTRDPFDALICAAAQTIDLPLITRDARDPRIGHGQGDLVIERTIAVRTHGRYLMDAAGLGRSGAAARRLPRLRGRRGSAARTDARAFQARTAGGSCRFRVCTASTSAVRTRSSRAG